MARILVVDDEPDLLETVRRILARSGHDVLTAPSGAEGLHVLERGGIELVLTDLMMPGIDGLGVVAGAAAHDPLTPVVLMTAYATVETAVSALRAGAWDYLAKPFGPDALRVVVDRALGHRALGTENRRLRAALVGPPLLGASAALTAVIETIERVAPTELSVLITGESGTGKEVVARALHSSSRRASRPFVPVDCGAIPPNLVESELFGHERGAFTGAESERRGLVEEADSGTFFLDEIGDLDATAQTRLLRLLQEGEFRRVGSNRLRKVDLRVVAATNRPLEDAVAAGRFRADLFHRLNVVRIHLPPLRERLTDVPVLVRHFVARFRAEGGRAPMAVGEPLLARFAGHTWPGNVRELANVCRYLAGLASGPEALISDLPPGFGGDVERGANAPTATTPPAGVRHDLPYAEAKRLWLDPFDEAYFHALLAAHDGNISAAARAADIDRKTVQRFLKRE
ncbi:MAG: sigma-54-dependent Fis family transcriptional regulator [Myxococcales bacterium]|nr:sigma-54-dependent Fis family transcriptional regulator [Myxococcales bacterium]